MPSVATAVRRRRAALREEAARRWREWAVALAAGERGPVANDVLATAAMLGIDADDAGDRLERDAEILGEHAEIERAIALCRETTAAALVPFGDLDGLLAAKAAAEVEAARLAVLIGEVSNEFSGGYWESRRRRLVLENPALFGGDHG